MIDAPVTFTSPRAQKPSVMVRPDNVRMRSMLFLVQFLSTCSGIDFKQPDELSCEKVRKPSGTDMSVQLDDICSCNETSGKCTLYVTLEFGHVMIPEESTGLAGPLHMLGFNAPEALATC